MNIRLLSITNAATRSNPRPGIAFYTEELLDIGFVPGALISVLPEPGGGIVFSLCDENIRSYRELDAATQEKGGKLIQVTYTTCQDKRIPLLATYGHILTDGGFAIGDEVIIQSEYGIVRVGMSNKKVRLVKMSCITYKRTGYSLSKLRLTGQWLADFGFVPDALLTAAMLDGVAVFELQNEGIEKYSDLVRYARQNRIKLIQVKTRCGRGKPPKIYPYIEVLGSWLAQAGFETGEKLMAVCEQGKIKLQKPDSIDLGF